MATSTVKQKVLDYIEHADEKKLEAIFLFIENEMEPEYEFTEAEMKELDSRWEDYLSGKSKSYTLEEAMNMLDTHRQNRQKNVV